MSAEPYLGEIMLFAGNFEPRGWAFCHGQLLPISNNDALFSLLGTMYGGDGRSTFGLPDLRGRVPIHHGQGPGLSPYYQGARGGWETVTLNQNEIPSHNHTISSNGGGGGTGGSSTADLQVFNGAGDTTDPSTAKSIASNVGNAFADTPTLSTKEGTTLKNAVTGISTGSGGGSFPSQTNNTGASQSHENRMPFLVINYCIATVGTFPSRS